MSNEQLLMIVAVPLLWNSVLYFALSNEFNRRIDDLKNNMNHRFEALEKLFTEKLHRIEDVWDTRIKAVEEKHK